MNKSGIVGGSVYEKGFSLVELMVVVAIIGILASVAVPQFQSFAYKARVTEAKGGLSGYYTAQKAFFGEWMQFDSRFGAIGFLPEGTYYFDIGTSVQSPVISQNYAGSNPSVTRIESSTTRYCANAGSCKSMSSAKSAIGGGGLALASSSVANGTSPQFLAKAEADGSLHPKAIYSVLTIDNWRQLKHLSGTL